MSQATPEQKPLSQLPPSQPSIRGRILAGFGVLLMAGALVAACIYTLPPLVSDWQVRNTAVPAEDGRVSSGKCQSRLIFHICDAVLRVPTKGGTVSRSVNYVFTDFHLGDYSVEVMADPARPELVTTDMALDKLWNRTLTLLLGGAFLLACVVLPVVAFFRNRRAEHQTGLSGA